MVDEIPDYNFSHLDWQWNTQKWGKENYVSK